MVKIIEDTVGDPIHFLKRQGVYHAGSHTVNHVVTEASGAASAGLGGMAGLGAMGLTAAVSAGLTQMDYYHERDNIRKHYQDELSVKLGKPVGKLTNSDLDELAKSNTTIAEGLNKARKQRNYGIGMAFVATLASLAVIKFAVLPLLLTQGIVPAGLGELFSLEATWKGLAGMAISMAAGVASYMAAKAPLHWLGNKLFGIDNETTHDRIVALGRERDHGKALSREQVASVFVKAHPQQLDGFIAEKYGDRFDKLSAINKQKATEELSTLIPINALTEGFNTNKLDVSSLAFAVNGEDISEIGRKHGPKKSGGLKGLLDKVAHPFAAKKEPTHLSIPVRAGSGTMEYENPSARSDNVARLGRGPRDLSQGYVQNAPTSQSIQ